MLLTLTLGDDAEEPLRELADWLGEEPQLRGRVQGRQRPPAAGEMGPVLDAVLVAVAPGGAATVLVTSLLSWLMQWHTRMRAQQRSAAGKVTVSLVRADGSRIALSATTIAALNPAQLQAQIEQLAALLDGPADSADDPMTGRRAGS